MIAWSFTGRYRPREMDDPHSVTKDIRSGGGEMARPENLTDDGNIERARQLIYCILVESSI